MSNETWRDEFYPCNASSEEALQAPAKHSLRKWIGFRKANLDKHKLSDIPMEIDASTCALCQKYEVAEDTCDNCPLCVVRGGYPCDEQTPREQEHPTECPYVQFTLYDDPEPMIQWLEKAVALEEDSTRKDLFHHCGVPLLPTGECPECHTTKEETE